MTEGVIKMRVIVADHHPEVRSALRLLLEERPGIKVISEVNKSDDLLAIMSSAKPDLVLLDWELPGTNLEKIVPLIHSLWPTPAIIVLSCLPQARDAALAAGATDFIYKSEPPEKLLDVLNEFISERPPGQHQDC
jgi:DNA-binding NarL/FixJ family response regulator